MPASEDRVLADAAATVESRDTPIPEETFRRAFLMVLRRYRKTFQGLAEFDKSR